ncbi:MAG TPA: glyoxylate/hydroxypyruvate reductase A [Telluria sp.]|nr:glyoxylate/hydroxypyruvate reductase A [Telluria sp.]
MRILLHRADGNTAPWVADFAQALPEAEVVVWREGEAIEACDYAVLWSPPEALVPELHRVKAIFLTGAGVDGIMKFDERLPDVPIIRLADAGMAIQMAEYVTHAVLGYYRRMPEYEAQAKRGEWKQLPQYRKEDFTVGVLGTGVLGMRVVDALRHFGFPVRGWSRSPKNIDGVESFTGTGSLDEFLSGSRVLVNMLPLTAETHSMLDHERLSKLPRGAYLVNVARGAHIVENDLLGLVQSGHIAGATLDVFVTEPLAPDHPFWTEPRVTVTPHVSALTLRRESIEQIAGKMRALARQEPVADVVDRTRGY